MHAISHTQGASTLDAYSFSYNDASDVTRMVSALDDATNYTGYDATDELTAATHADQANDH